MNPVEVRKRFHKINVEVSNICNLQCSFCPEVKRDKDRMSVELFETIVSQAAPLTELICFHLMGEPLTHPQLSELIEICKKHSAKVFFVTNGVLLKPEHTELLTQDIFQQVNFSLHSFFDNYPEKNPDLYIKKILTWTDYALTHNPELYINYRLWNLAGLDSTSAKAKRNQEMLNLIENHFGVDLSSLSHLKKNKSRHIQGRLYMHFDTEFIWPSLQLPQLGTKGTCYGLTSHFGILVDGSVVPCCLDKEGDINLGNIKDQTLVEILNSSRASAILNGFNQNQLTENLCQRCQYITRFQ